MAENPLKTMESIDPELMKIVEAIRKFALADGALPRKFKFLIAMALDATHGAVGGVTALAQAAMREGATKEEVVETLRVVQFVGSVSSVYTAGRALQDIF